MNLLLDSHAFLWYCEGNAQLSKRAREAIEPPNNESWVSHVTAWEFAIKQGLGKLKLLAPYDDLFPGALRLNGFHELTPSFRHYHALLQLPWHHRDPFDRLLIAQAKAEGMTLVSCDSNVPAYDVPLLW